MQSTLYAKLFIFVSILVTINAAPSTANVKRSIGSSFFKSTVKATIGKQSGTCGSNPVICSVAAQTCCKSGFSCCNNPATHCCRNDVKCCGSTCCLDDGSSTCFPQTAKVLLESGTTLEMKDLKVGDSVQVGPKTFSKVFMFTHQNPSSKNARYIELTTHSNHTIKATKGHVIYACRPRDGATTCTPNPMKIESVAAGDYLPVLGSATKFTLSAVTIVAEVPEQGIYNPQTIHGDIIVNGVRCSTYTDAVQYNAAHGLLAPLRAIARATLPLFATQDTCKSSGL